MTALLPPSIPCPKCGAAAGQHCQSLNGHRTTIHTARLEAILAARARKREAA